MLLNYESIPACYVSPSAFFLFGCKSVNTIKPSDTLSKKAFIEDVRVVTDPFLQSRAKVLGINETLIKGGFSKFRSNWRISLRGPSM